MSFTRMSEVKINVVWLPDTLHGLRVGIKGNNNLRIDQNGYVVIPHGTEYSVCVHNSNSHSRASAEIFIDGLSQGAFIVGSNKSISIERPINQARKFTFYITGTPEANQAELSHGNTNNGLVRVVCHGEKDRNSVNISNAKSAHSMMSSITNCLLNDSQNDYVSGGTGLGATSSQTFKTSLFDTDLDTRCEFNLRLVGMGTNSTPSIVPLSSRNPILCTPIPPPVQGIKTSGIESVYF